VIGRRTADVVERLRVGDTARTRRADVDLQSNTDGRADWAATADANQSAESDYPVETSLHQILED
jgi:hypothetical protein